jgi:hypothetical protein
VSWTLRRAQADDALVLNKQGCEGTREPGQGGIMIVLGIILLVVGWLIGIQILFTIGIILIVIGVILELLGAIGRPIGGRRHYY